MKRLWGIIFTALTAFTMALTTSAQIATYNLSSDFSTNQNPTGVWSYGYLTNLNSGFVLFTNRAVEFDGGGVSFHRWWITPGTQPILQYITGGTGITDGGQGVFPPQTVIFVGGDSGTGADYCAARFTAPASGTYSISVGATNYLNGPSSGDTDFHIRSNGVAIVSRNFPATIATNVALTMTLSAGSTIDIAVGRGADNIQSGSGLKIGARVDLTSLTGSAPSPSIYNLSSDFSTNQNPTGVWSYGYLTNLTSGFALFTNRAVEFDGGGVSFHRWWITPGTQPILQYITGGTGISDGGQGVFPPGTVIFQGGDSGGGADYCVARFTAPTNGTYTITVGATNYLNGPSSGDTDFHIRSNGVAIVSRNFPATIATNVVLNISLSAGSTIDIAVGRGADNIQFGSGLKIGAVITSGSGPAVQSILSQQLPTTINPANGWTLGWKGSTNGAFTAYTARFPGSANGGSWEYWGRVANSEGYIRKNIGPGVITDPSQGAFPVGSINAVAGPNGAPDNYAVARYTIPASGYYRVTVWGTAPGSGDIDVHVANNSIEAFGKSVAAGEAAAFTNTTSYSVGDVIDIAVGRGADNNNSASVYLFDAIVEPVSPPAIRLSTSFPTSANPSGGWTLGFKGATNGALVIYTNLVPDTFGNSSFVAWKRIVNDDSLVRVNQGPGLFNNGAAVIPAGSVNLIPGPNGRPDNYAVARYTIPSAGNYRLTSWASPVFPSGQGDTDFHVLVNGILVRGAFLSGSASFGYTNQFTLAAGDTVEIASGRGADNNVYASYLNSDLLIENQGAVVVPPPDIVFSPASGSFTNQVTVGLVNNLGAGSEIRYTINDVDPTSGSLLYMNFLTINSNATIRARLFANGSPVSAVFTNAYTKANDVQFSPLPGSFTNLTTVSLVNLIGSGQMRYTINGSDPTASSTLYSTPLTITSNATFRAGLFLNGFPISTVSTGAFTQVLAEGIRFGPAPGLFTNSLTVRLTNTFGSGEMRFTINGAAPTASSPLYAGAFTITSNATIRAGLFLNGATISAVSVGDYGRVYALADGVPNSWRLQYFGAAYLTDPRVGAGTDADGDGSSNLQEYLAGTDPLNSLSGFTVGIQAIPRITFVSIPGTTYKILRRDNANALTGVEVGQVTAVATQTTFIDTSVTNPTGFYTVQPVP